MPHFDLTILITIACLYLLIIVEIHQFDDTLDLWTYCFAEMIYLHVMLNMNCVHVLIMYLSWKFNRGWYMDTDLKLCRINDNDARCMIQNDYIVVSIN